MAKHCSLCTKEYDLEDYEPSSKIFKIMEEKNLCFSCAFWTWRLAEDKALELLHNNQGLFVAKLRKEVIKPIYPWEDFEQSDTTLLSRYHRWIFGRPIILDGSHYIIHVSVNIHTRGGYLYPEYYILMDDGTIYPYQRELITHQGTIPAHFMWSENTPSGFKNNAVLLSNLDIEELKAKGIREPFINKPNTVPQEIVKKYFNNLDK